MLVSIQSQPTVNIKQGDIHENNNYLIVLMALCGDLILRIWSDSFSSFHVNNRHNKLSFSSSEFVVLLLPQICIT